MIIVRKDKETLRTELVNAGEPVNPEINFQPHEVIDDFFLSPLATISSDLYTLMYYVSGMRSLSTLEKMILDTTLQADLARIYKKTTVEIRSQLSDDLTNLVKDWNVIRKDPIVSAGFVRIYFTSASSQTIASGKTVSTKGNPAISFTTTGTLSNAIPTLDFNLGLYYLEVSVEATSAGKLGNVRANAITTIVSSIAGAVAVNNVVATSGGTDTESDSDLISRAREKWKGQTLNTRSGYNSFTAENPRVIDVYTASKKSDPNAVLRDNPNALDIFVITSPRLQTVTEKVVYNDLYYRDQVRKGNISGFTYPPSIDPSKNIDYYFEHQPVKSISQIRKDSTPLNPVYYTFVADLSPLSGSSKGFDKVTIIGAALTGVSTVEFDVVYDGVLSDLQNTIKSPENDVVGSDVLFRVAQAFPVNINVNLVGAGGYALSDVQTNVASDLDKFFNGGVATTGVEYLPFRLGEGTDFTDIERVILNVAGVDRIRSGGLTVQINGGSFTDTITLEPWQYLSLNSVVFNSSVNSTTV